MPHLERPVIHDSCGILFPYALAVDELMNNKVPPRGEYLRVMMAEFNRIISNMYYLGIFGLLHRPHHHDHLGDGRQGLLD